MGLMIDCGAGGRYTNMTYPPSSDHSTFKKRVELATRSLVTSRPSSSNMCFFRLW